MAPLLEIQDLRVRYGNIRALYGANSGWRGGDCLAPRGERRGQVHHPDGGERAGPGRGGLIRFEGTELIRLKPHRVEVVEIQ